jgi:tetratricopeptide (TPR) repeat protein
MDEAVSLFQKAIEKDHLYSDPYKALYFIWDKQKKYNNIIHFTENILKEHLDIDITHKAYLLYRAGKAYDNLHKYEQALSNARQAVSLNDERKDYKELVKKIESHKKKAALENFKAAQEKFSAGLFEEAFELVQKAMRNDNSLSEARKLFSDIQKEIKSLQDQKEAVKLKANIMAIMRSDDLEKALLQCETAIDIQPQNADFFNLKEQIKAKIEKIENEKKIAKQKAEEEIKRKNQLEYHSELGVRAMKLEQYKEALKSFEIVLSIDPARQNIRENLDTAKKAIALENDINEGKKAMAEGHLDKAEEKFRAALLQVPESNSICMLLVKCYKEKNNPDAAIKTITDFLKIKPNTFDLYYEAAKIHVQNNDIDKSLPMFRQYLDNVKTDFNAAIEYAQALDKINQKDEALKYLQRLHASNPNKIDFIREIAKIQEKMGNFDDALRTYKKLIARGNQDLETEAFYNMGCLYTKMELYNDALERFRKVQKIDPGYKDTSIRVDKLRWKKYMPIVYTAGAIFFLFALKIFFSIIGGFFEKMAEKGQKKNLLKAKKLISQKKYDKAVAMYENIIKKQSLNISEKKEVIMGLASALFKLKKYDKAIFNAQQVVDLDRKNIKAYTLLAEAYNKSGNHENAVNICRSAFDIDMGVPTLHKVFQDSYLNINNLEELLMEYDEFAYEHPRNLQLSNIILKLKKDNNIN